MHSAAGPRAVRSKGGRPHAIADVLAAFLDKHGLRSAMEDHRLALEWSEIVGVALAGECRPVRIERGTVWIGVNSAPQANHLLYLKPWILKRIRERFPDSSIRELQIQHRPGQGRGAR
jgi:hypothetical protein